MPRREPSRSSLRNSCARQNFFAGETPLFSRKANTKPPTEHHDSSQFPWSVELAQLQSHLCAGRKTRDFAGLLMIYLESSSMWPRPGQPPGHLYPLVFKARSVYHTVSRTMPTKSEFRTRIPSSSLNRAKKDCRSSPESEGSYIWALIIRTRFWVYKIRL